MFLIRGTSNLKCQMSMKDGQKEIRGSKVYNHENLATLRQEIKWATVFTDKSALHYKSRNK